MIRRTPSALPSDVPRPRRRGLGAERLAALASSLSQRDISVLTSIAEHRFLTSAQVQRLHFYNHATLLSGTRSSRRVVRRLHRDGLIVLLPRLIGGLGAGSGASVWHLSGAGKRILSIRSGQGSTLTATRLRDPSTRFVSHALAIAEARVCLVEAARSGLFGLKTVEIEPRSWRQFVGAYGAEETLKPDFAVVTTSVDGEFEDRWFVEVDLGTEHLPTVLRKCQQYETYRRTGDEQRRHGVFPIVLWLTTTDARATTVRRAIQSSHSLDQELYRVTAIDGLVELVAGGPA